MLTNVVSLEETKKQKLLYNAVIRYPIDYFSGYNSKSTIQVPQGVTRDNVDRFVSLIGKIAHGSTNFSHFKNAWDNNDFSGFLITDSEEKFLVKHGGFKALEKYDFNSLVTELIPGAVGKAVQSVISYKRAG